jgi:hypothetical protein
VQEELFGGRIHLDPIDSGLDLILAGVEALAASDPGPHERKRAVLDLSAGVGILLRERLRQEHWSAVFSDPNQASRADHERGSFQPVGMVAGLDRLVRLCGLKASARWRWGIESLSQSRERIEARGLVDAKSVLAVVTCAVTSPFIDSVPAGRLTVTLTALLARIQAGLKELDSYISARLGRIDGRGPEETYHGCPQCRMENTLVIDGGPVCLYCGYSGDPESVAAECAQVMFNPPGERHPCHCPTCGRETLIDAAGADEPPWYKCYACGVAWAAGDLEFCYYCGRPFETNETDPEEDLCERCRQLSRE